MSTTLRWRKSSYSGGQGGACVEVARLSVADWRKSTYSGGEGGNCVEVAGLTGVIVVRDSKDPDGPALGLTSSEWRVFVRGIKPGSSA